MRIDEASLRRVSEAPQPAIFAYWHDQILVSCAFLTRHLIGAGRPVAVMISPSWDGELVTRTVRPLGITVVRGSASRDGARALRALYRHVSKEGSSPVLLPDGPKGPAFEAKPGTVVLAQMTGAPIVPLAFRVARSLRLGSWDRMRLPLPFTRIDVVAGEPMAVDRELDDDGREACRLRLQEEMSRLREDLARRP